MSKTIEAAALSVSEETAKRIGVYVVGTAYTKNEDGDYSLCYYIDKDGGVGIDECEAFSRAIEEVLDRGNLISDKYILEVSSPGVDRTLKTQREFEYYKGREVDVKLYAAINGLKEFSGILCDVQNDTVTIEYENEKLNIPLEQAVYIKLAFRF